MLLSDRPLLAILSKKYTGRYLQSNLFNLDSDLNQKEKQAPPCHFVNNEISCENLYFTPSRSNCKGLHNNEHTAYIQTTSFTN